MTRWFAAHAPLTQLAFAQSAVITQLFRYPQPGHAPPPQSTSVSTLFFTPSVHVGAHVVPVQTPPLQSPPTLQTWPVSQWGHCAPPQSTSVSRPFFCPSPQLGEAHACDALQTFIVGQSASTRHG